MKTDKINIEHAKQDLERIQQFKNLGGMPEYNLQSEEKIVVQINLDNTVEPAMFVPDQEKPGEFKANELTIRAMRKDVFACADSIDELKAPYECYKCNFKIDKQFWLICPNCGNDFKE